MARSSDDFECSDTKHPLLREHWSLDLAAEVDELDHVGRTILVDGTPSDPACIERPRDYVPMAHRIAYEEDAELLGDTHLYWSTPAPPENLWDSDDLNFLDKVICRMSVYLTHIDPKTGEFNGRLKLQWQVRTRFPRHERTEPRIRIPGLRMRGITEEVQESRMWRVPTDTNNSTKHSLLWNGSTTILFSGYEMFEIHDFPFDRQIINLHDIDFVWRAAQDSRTHEDSLKIVSLRVNTYSLVPEWTVYNALVSSSFQVLLRIQRKPNYYITQVFLVSSLILGSALFPLALNADRASDRLYIHCGGLLTLIAFKYSVTSELPVVPYTTFTVRFLNYQIITIVAVMLETIAVWKIVSCGWFSVRAVEWVDDCLLLALLVVWLIYFIHASFFKGYHTWREVLKTQQAYETHWDGTQVTSGDLKYMNQLLGTVGYIRPTNAIERLREKLGSHPPFKE